MGRKSISRIFAISRVNASLSGGLVDVRADGSR